ncbi:hypothetical protein NE237_020612 [Protea cynaroides]|uniref:F-box domain-containing protein n=1 Tax=Protea cynaroides TaxID=273540 RepID=A0A9Q0HAW9_9MAGN|nr:hypothetical protein NE237_020612 [Protea cynaroides]
MAHEEALRLVFPLLNGRDLASCMQVCKHWRDVAGDDYFWKCLCAKRWPSIMRRHIPPPESYREFFQMFAKRSHLNRNLCPRFSFDDLEFFVDVWVDERVVFSEVFPGSLIRDGIENLPPNVRRLHEYYLDRPGYKMILPVKPNFSIRTESAISVSVIAGRRDINKLVPIFTRRKVDILGDAPNFLHLAPIHLDTLDIYVQPDDPIFLNYAPTINPNTLKIYAPHVFVSLLFMPKQLLDNPDASLRYSNIDEIRVFGVALDFGRAVKNEDDLLSLLRILDWDLEVDVLTVVALFYCDELKGLPFRPVVQGIIGSTELPPSNFSVLACGVFHPFRACDCNTDLASCMQVCKHWRDVAGDDYFWKCLCAKRWPSIMRRHIPPPESYREFFQMFAKRSHLNQNLCPRFSFDDLEFFVDVWVDEIVIFSEVFPGSLIRDGIENLPPNVRRLHEYYLDRPGYKMILPVKPKSSIRKESAISVSVIAGRRDINKLVLIFARRKVDILGDAPNFLHLAPIHLDTLDIYVQPDDPIFLNYAPTINPNTLKIYAPHVFVSLLFMPKQLLDNPDASLRYSNIDEIHVFGVALDFGRAVKNEDDLLSLLRILDWDLEVLMLPSFLFPSRFGVSAN